MSLSFGEAEELFGQMLDGALGDEEITRLRDLARIEIPYEDPLVIPVGIQTSKLSWGNCKQ